jgi:hypothetical protein
MAGNVLLLVENKDLLQACDTWLQSRLATLGYTVTTRDVNDAVNTSGFVLLVISGVPYIGQSLVNYSGQNIPVVCISRGAWPMLGWSTGNGAAVGNAGQLNLDRFNTPHELHVGGTGPADILTSSTSYWRYPQDRPAAIVNRWGVGSGGPVFFTIEAGSSLLDGKQALQRQVGLGYGNENANITSLTATGLAVFDAAVAWTALEDPGTQLPTPTGLTFTAVPGVRQLDGAWNAVSGAGGYDWQVEVQDGAVWLPFDDGANPAQTTTFMLTAADGVEWGTTYRARVRATP